MEKNRNKQKKEAQKLNDIKYLYISRNLGRAKQIVDTIG